MAASARTGWLAFRAPIDGLAARYDLILTFDYENLHTSIEENARLLKARYSEQSVPTTKSHQPCLPRRSVLFYVSGRQKRVRHRRQSPAIVARARLLHVFQKRVEARIGTGRVRKQRGQNDESDEHQTLK